MSERENIFTRIREALTVPAPVAGTGHGAKEAPATLPTVADHRRVMPAVGSTPAEQMDLFARNAADLKVTFKQIRDGDGLAAELKALCAAEGWARVGAHRGDLAEPHALALGLPVLLTNPGFSTKDLEQCDAGISECDALIAQTGTVVVTSRSAGGRALSCLPPHHVVIARRNQLVPDLPAAFAMLKSNYGDNYPSMISFTSGPSRTGDIERILVLGAHGPKKLTIFCLE